MFIRSLSHECGRLVSLVASFYVVLFCDFLLTLVVVHALTLGRRKNLPHPAARTALAWKRVARPIVPAAMAAFLLCDCALSAHGFYLPDAVRSGAEKILAFVRNNLQREA